MPAVSPDEADAILIPFTNFGYFASSLFAHYKRQSFGQFGLMDTRTKKLVFLDWVIYKAPDSKFEYGTYADLKENIVPAVGALQDVAKNVAAQVVRSIE